MMVNQQVHCEQEEELSLTLSSSLASSTWGDPIYCDQALPTGTALIADVVFWHGSPLLLSGSLERALIGVAGAEGLAFDEDLIIAA